MELKRLNKYISDTGKCSRREADAYIAGGEVTINGKIATLGSQVEEGDSVKLKGKLLHPPKKRNKIYIAFNKPTGITCTTDLADKTNIIDFVGHKERIFHIGRLDKPSEGLIFLTNDGDIVNKILRSGNNHEKEYIVSVDKPVTDEFIKKMSTGVRILGVTTKPCKVTMIKPYLFRIVLTQGLNRQIRRMCEVLGYEVTKLKRVRIMNMTLTGLAVGQWRYFTPKEIEDLNALVVDSTGLYDESLGEPKAARGGATTVKKSSGRRRAGRPAQLPKSVLEKRKQEELYREKSSRRGSGDDMSGFTKRVAFSENGESKKDGFKKDGFKKGDSKRDDFKKSSFKKDDFKKGGSRRAASDRDEVSFAKRGGETRSDNATRFGRRK